MTTLFRRVWLLVIFMPLAHALAQNKLPATGSDERVVAALNLDTPGLEAAKAALERHDMPAAQAAYLAYRRTASPAAYFVMSKDQPAQATASSDVQGDEVCNHFIRNPYGFQPLSADMGKEFNWTYNPVSRSSPDFTHEWTFCAISRMPFWRVLADAYWKTRDEKYAREWVAQLHDFAGKNPVDLTQRPDASLLWRSLDASIRMSDSWPYAYYHFLGSPSFTPDDQWTYMRLIYDHALRLKNGLEDSQRAGNWVISECNGLYTIGALFPEFRDAESWRALAMDRLIAELQRSVAPDGFEAELTPNYHYFSLTSYLGPYQLAKLNHLPIPPELHSKLLAMYRAPIWVMDQEGNVVPTNDSHTLNAISKAREGLTVVGEDPLLKWAVTGGTEGTAPPGSTMLPYAGFYAMRGGWRRDDLFLFFRGGPAGIGHEHEDMLEIVLRAWNKTLLLDPGSYPYDSSDWRRYVIGTASHNTVIVDDKWQHRGPSKAPLDTPVHNPWVTTPLFDYVAATYDGGYQQNVYDPQRSFTPQKWVGELDRSVTHTRRVLFLKPYYAIVLDSLNGSGRHTFDAHFHMDAPAARLDNVTQAAFTANPGQVQLALYPLDHENLITDIIQGQQQPLLGWMPVQHRPIPTIRFRKTQEAPAQLATFLYPYMGSAEHSPDFSGSPMAENQKSSQGLWAETAHTAYEDLEIALLKSDKPADIACQSALLGSFNAHAAAVIIRRATQDHMITAGAWDLTVYRDAQWSWTLDAPAALLWREQPDQLLVYNAASLPVSMAVSAPFAVRVSIAPHTWSVVTRSGAVPATAPILFKPVSMVTDAPSYADYLQTHAAQKFDNATKLVRFSAKDMQVPPTVKLRDKVGATDKVIVGWDDAGSLLSLQIPTAGWYRIRIRYCAQGNPVRTLLVDGKVPFAEADHLALQSTQGAPPSDGWSNTTDDWHTVMLGARNGDDGWKCYLPQGTLSLRNESGGGANVDWIELDPVR